MGLLLTHYAHPHTEILTVPRKLVILPDEADRVRHIFDRYLELGSVYALQSELAAHGIKTKARMLKDGRTYGGCNFSKGSLYLMLRNRTYLGEITHRGKSYPGEHVGIVDRDLFEKVGLLLEGNRVDNKNAVHADHPSLFAGILWDGEGRRMSPNHANKNGARYRYYVSKPDKERLELPTHRIPAGDIENLVAHQLRRNTEASWATPAPSRELVLTHIERIIVHPDQIIIQFKHREEPVTIMASLIRCNGESRIATPSDNWPHARRDPSLIKLVVRAHQARKAISDPANLSLDDAATSMGLSTQYFCALLRLGHLAPDITAAILDGRQPAHLNRQHLARINNLPVDWTMQREMLGFA